MTGDATGDALATGRVPTGRVPTGRVLRVLSYGLVLAGALSYSSLQPAAAAQVLDDGDPLSPGAEAVTDASPAPSNMAYAVRAPVPPVIDGRDTDAIWRTAPGFSDFRQFAPRVDAEPTFRTEFRVAFDEDRLYVYVRAWDPHPDSIMRALTRRDVRGPSDQITVIVDSYNDRRTGFEFHVNPDGVKRDHAIYNDTQEDSSWDGVWDVETVVDSLGWAAEFSIPLSQLRYADAPRHTFGLSVRRDIERFAERVAWPAYSPTRRGLASQLGQLGGLVEISSARSVELTPYLLTENVTEPLSNGRFGRGQNVAVGGDLKVSITPNVTLDATMNPEFGQVEADPADLNLSAFETFLREQRPFFVEGAGLYRFQLNCYIVVDCNTNEGLFYSRRIGRAPALLGENGDDDTPTATPISAAAKVTGRTAGGLSFGLMDAVTRHVGGIENRTAEPRTNFAVVRAQQDLRGGEADISLIGTAVNRSLDAWTRERMHQSAYATGLSARNRFGGGDYEVTGSVTASRVAGHSEAITRTQLNSVHYYQQPGDDLELDSARTSLTGHAEQIKIGKYGGGFTRFESSFVHQSAGFDVNDLGFLRRADRLNWSTWASLSFQDQRWIYRWASVNANHWQTWTTSGLQIENAWNFNGHMGLNNNWNVHGGGTFGGLGDTFCDRCARGGPAMRKSRGFFPWFGFNGDNRRTVIPSVWVNLRYTDEGATHGASISPTISIRPSPSLQTSWGFSIDQGDTDSQWYGNTVDGAGTTHYTFAHLDQRTLSLTARINYTASPDLTLEVYAQPFVSTGTYSDVREVSATPEAESYDDRFQTFTPPPGSQTTFRFSQLRTNTVLRWEYRPGSTLFLVWAHGRQAFSEEEARHSWGNDFLDILDVHADNTFLIKVAHWFNW